MQDHPSSVKSLDAKPHRSLFERLTALISPEPENRAELLEVLHDAHERNLIDADALSMIEGGVHLLRHPRHLDHRVFEGITALAVQPAQDLCPAPASQLEAVSVQRVVDGDTVRLRDGRSVRMIGLNTPELGKKGRSDEPFAMAARKRLEMLVAAARTYLSRVT